MTEPLKDQVPCGCGRSATGFCTGLHEMSAEQWDRMLLEEWNLLEPSDPSPAQTTQK